MSSPIIGPVPAYNNPPIEPQFYQPSQFFIASIAMGQTTTVTTSMDQNYVIGQEVRLLIPPLFGCRELNQKTGFVISIPAADQVVLDIYSLGANPFVIPSVNTTQAQIIAVGDINSGSINASGRVNNITYIQGSFINISPN